MFTLYFWFNMSAHRIINQYIKYALLIAIAYCTASSAYAQNIIKGVVTDADTGEPLPFVNVFEKNTLSGTTTDFDGIFSFTATSTKDTISFRLIGYEEQSFVASTLMGDTCRIMLSSSVVSLSEIEVKPTNQALLLTKKAIEAKKIHNLEKYDNTAYEKYSKWQFDLNNISDRVKNSWLFKGGENLMRYSDDSTRYLPVYFSEQLSYNESQKDPMKQRSTIIADRTNGLDILKDYEISGYTSALDMEVNFYTNVMMIFGQSFISPIADNAPFYYNYYLKDSLETDKGKNYIIRFKSKRPGDKTFTGQFTLETNHYSITEIEAELSEKSNINFVKSLVLSSEYQLIDDSLFFYKRNQISATIDYIPINTNKKRLELNYLMMNSVDKVSINNNDEIKLSRDAMTFETIKKRDVHRNDLKHWESIRHESLSKTDQNVLASIDSLNNLKTVKFMDNLARMFVTGYYDLGTYEFGPWMETINANKVEGLRVHAGLRTGKEFSEKWQLWGGLGYGTRTEKIAGSAGIGYKFDSPFRKVIRASYEDKIVRIGENDKINYLYENMMGTSESNLVAMIMQRDPVDELLRELKIRLDYEHEWRTGLESKFKLLHNIQFSPEYYPFIKDGKQINRISQNEIAFDTRWSTKEKYIEDGLQRFYISTRYPIVHFTIAGGETVVDGTHSLYGRIHSTLKHSFFIGLGEVNYAIEGGAIIGKMPYSMLEIPRGNKTYGLYSYDFNLLDYLEFANDIYLNTYMDYHLNGFFFNRVPLLKNLGLREVVGFKSIIGHLDNRHRDVIDYAENMRPLNGAYIELNAGVENIIRFFRIDAIWRVTPQSITGAPQFGFRAQFNIKL